MKANDLLDLIGNTDDNLITEAKVQKKTKKNAWVKWIAAAACFALVVAAGIPIINDFTQGPDKYTVGDFLMIEYDNAYYEIIENNPDFLKRKGIVTDISKDVAGKHITYLKKISEAKRSNYMVSAEETNTELLEYAPANQKAVRIFRDGDKYYAAVFCNYLIDDNESLPFDEVFKVYGISKAEDIKSIVSVKTNNMYKANGIAVTDSDLIVSFYNEIINLKPYSEDEFDETQFTYEDENKADEYHRKFADDANDFMIETVDGLRFIIRYFPTYDWVDAPLLQTYYKLSPALEAWIETNLK